MQDDCFAYQPELKKGNKYLPDFLGEPIEQNIIPLYNKLDIFLEALEHNNEIDKKEKLYEDTIDLYEEKKQFSLLIPLFLKIYENNKELCSKLIEIFYKINDKENTDKVKDLKKELKSFKDIYSNARYILKEKNYDPIHFYGIIFCYLHFYDKNDFPKMIEEFSEGNSENLYEILIQYSSHFINPLKQKQKFYDNFVRYTLKKEKKLKHFKQVLKYIEDIETYLFVINSNKKEILEKYDKLRSDPLKIPSNLKLIKYSINYTEKVEANTKKITSNKNSDDESDEDDANGLEQMKNIENECDKIKVLINEIIEYSKVPKCDSVEKSTPSEAKKIDIAQGVLVIYLRSIFWINLIKEYNYPNWENIRKVHELRELFKSYNVLINNLYKDNIKDDDHKNNKENIFCDIKNDIITYYRRDEFAMMLNKNINKFIENEKDRITNAEILGTVVYYNPYFSIRDEVDKERFKNNRETYIFDYINFDKITPTFIENFKKFKFEEIFEENIGDYINKITGKIKDIQTFGNIIKLINVEEIREDKQKKEYFRKLEEEYKFVIKDNIKLVKEDKELNKVIKIISEFISKIFLFENSTRFLEEEISSLENNIKSKIYLELISTYNEDKYKEQKNYIYGIYLTKCDTKEGRDNIIELIRKLKYDDKNYFIYEKLLEKCKFEKEEFLSNHENYKIQTLCLLKKELFKESQKEDENPTKDEKNKDKKKDLKLDIVGQKLKGNKHAEDLETKLDNIMNDLDKGKIAKKDLEKFLNIKTKEGQENENEKGQEKSNKNKNESKPINDENDSYVMDKLELITLITENYDSKKQYAAYRANIKNINDQVKELKFIKNSLMIFHRNLYHEDIKTITNILDEIENSPIQQFRLDKTKESIKDLTKHRTLCDEIEKVKNFLLFKKIFENAQGIDQAKRFEDASKKLKDLKDLFTEKSKNEQSKNEQSIDIEKIFNNPKYKEIFKNIKEELGKKAENKSKEFIDQMIGYFEIKDTKIKKELKMIIKSKQYENIVKSIKYFFDNFSDKNLSSLNNMNLNLSEISLTELKNNLEQLKRDIIFGQNAAVVHDIFNYESNSSFYQVFLSIYEKKEAIDFLISKLKMNIKSFKDDLIEKLDPTNRSISIRDIDDATECLKHFKSFEELDFKGMLNYIKLLDEEKIKQFVRFTKKYSSIIELDSKKGEDNFKQVYDNIENASLLFNLDGEDFCYKINGKTKKIDLEELKKLKNKINIQKKTNENGDKIKKVENNKEKDKFEEKCDKLIFFKDIVTNLEIIYDKMDALRKKGFNIPIVINIAIEYYPKKRFKRRSKSIISIKQRKKKF